MNVVTTVYEQQWIMFESGTHSISRRIVSLAQPWVRPIVRGKAHASTEFGPKLHISLVDGYARIERLDFEPFNESEDLWRAVARYRERYGCYPERVLADKIYRSRQTLAFCKEHGIRLSGPALGKPPKDSVLSRQAKKQSIRTTATATQWRVFSGQARPLMVWAASWHTCRKLLSVSLALPCSS